MKFKTMDDYYAWTCDWCDSENRSLWVKVANGGILPVAPATGKPACPPQAWPISACNAT